MEWSTMAEVVATHWAVRAPGFEVSVAPDGADWIVDVGGERPSAFVGAEQPVTFGTSRDALLWASTYVDEAAAEVAAFEDARERYEQAERTARVRADEELSASQDDEPVAERS